MTTLYFVTGNAGKSREVAASLRGLRVAVEPVDLTFDEIQGTVPEIVRAKAHAAWQCLKDRTMVTEADYVLVDDVSLELGVLGGFPGPYVKDFLRVMTLDRIHALCYKMGDLGAAARCTFCIYNGHGEPRLLDGTCSGTICAASGDSGFGWDPIFKPDGATKTFAEMTVEEKSRISHRGKACQKLSEFLKTQAEY